MIYPEGLLKHEMVHASVDNKVSLSKTNRGVLFAAVASVCLALMPLFVPLLDLNQTNWAAC